MIENNVVEWSGRETDRDALTELIRTAGARYLITKALQAEVSKLLSMLAARRGARDDAE
jgi:hypothetical protein